MSTTLTVDFFCSIDGYGTAKGWPGYWGKEGPELIDEPYYDSVNELPKLVFSGTLEEPLGWQNSTLINEDAVTAIERLKRTTDVPMRSHGSISLNRSLLAAGLVDRIELMMFPVITGRAGEAALFHDGAEFDLDLIESTVLVGRTHKLVYTSHLHHGIPA